MRGDFDGALEEWLKDHRLFVATLEELAGQLALLQPAQTGSSQPVRPAAGAGSSSGGGGDERKELLARLMERAPSEQLRTYVEGRLPAAPLQRTLPEQLDENMRLLSILAAEMRALAQRLEQMADGAAAAAVQAGDTPSGDAAADRAAAAEVDAAVAADHGQGSSARAESAPDAEAALLLAAVADGVAKETLLITKAAAGTTLTTPPEEVSAAATVLQLEPFLSSTLLAAVKEGPAEGAEESQHTAP